MSFKERFLDAQSAFLAALSSGTSALAQFNTEWESLGNDFERALDQAELDAGDVDVAYAVSSRIAILGNSALKLEEESTNQTEDFLTAVTAVLADLDLEDVSAKDVSQYRHIPPYIPSAFSWLQENMHDPYPPTSLKRIWARESHITPRVMDDWFKSIRKEIGWVTLTKAHFNGSRSLAVKAAGAVLLQQGDDTDVPFEVQTELLAIKARLETFYLEERGVVAGRSARDSGKRPRSVTCSPVATTPRSCSPSTRSDSSSDADSTASSSPASRSTSRLPSLVFDQSDSEEDERLPEFPAVSLPHDGSVFITGAGKDFDVSENRLTRIWYVSNTGLITSFFDNCFFPVTPTMTFL